MYGKEKSANGQDSKKTIPGTIRAYVQKGAKHPYYTTSTLSPPFRKCRVSSARVLNLGGLPFPHLINTGHPKAPFLFLLSLSLSAGGKEERARSVLVMDMG